jgi:ABC-type uncharacterized transport system YnjBCD permease subunit
MAMATLLADATATVIATVTAMAMAMAIVIAMKMVPVERSSAHRQNHPFFLE